MSDKKSPDHLEPSPQLDLFRPEQKPPAQTARASARGYFYQLRYAAVRALSLKSGEILGFELIDDVDIASPDGKSEIVQVKDETTPLTDKSRGLWKALSHWVYDAEGNVAYFNQIKNLLFVTTAPIRQRSLPALLATDSSVGDRMQYIKSIPDSKDEELQKWICTVRAMPQPRLAALIGRVRVIAQGDAESLHQKMKARFHELLFPDARIDEATQRFEGWLMQRVLDAFVANEGARVGEDTVRELLTNMISGMCVDPMLFRHTDTPIDMRLREAYRQRTFVRQLEAIDAPVDEIEDALVDYFRNTSERVDWAKYQDVSDGDLNAFEIELQRRWKQRFRDIGERRQGLDEAKWGRRLYSEIMENERALLRSREPPSHVIKGSYHKLADDAPPLGPCVGWHPRWEAFFASRVVKD